MHLDDTGLTATGQTSGPIAAAWAAFASSPAAHFFALQNLTGVHERYKPLRFRNSDPKTGKGMPSSRASIRPPRTLLVPSTRAHPTHPARHRLGRLLC